MNAPWKPAGQGTRDPFAAYLADDASIDTVRNVIADLGWVPEKAAKGTLRTAVQSLSMANSPNILLIDLSESADPLADINALAEVCEPGTVVIAVGLVNDVRLYRDLLAHGIHDYLLKPLSMQHTRDAILHAQTTFADPREPAQDATHQSIAVIGTRGGAGASTLATSLAWSFAVENNQSTGLLDLDIHFGTGALVLDLEPGRGLTDAIDNPSRIDGLFIERAMIRAHDNLAILSAEAPINQPLLTDGAAFLQLQEEFRHAFQTTVIDLPRSMLINFPHLLADVNTIVVVTEMTLAGARDSIRLLSWLRANCSHARIVTVANKLHAQHSEISRADFEASIERKLDYLIPFDLKAASHAAKLGQTFLEANRAAKSGQLVAQIAADINGGEAKAGAKSSLLDLFDFKSLLGKKAEKPAAKTATPK